MNKYVTVFIAIILACFLSACSSTHETPVNFTGTGVNYGNNVDATMLVKNQNNTYELR